MKLLIFAHTPPPHHGQSYLVQIVLEGFGGAQQNRTARKDPLVLGIDCYHVNARFSQSIQDIGGFRFSKLAWLARYCLQAIWLRFRYGATTFYYIPAPSQRAALYRDWLVMILCRPFFPKLVFHWHAAGLGEWLDSSAPKLIRWISQLLLGRADLSIVPCKYHCADAARLHPRRLRVVNNGVRDPRPNFQSDLLPTRLARFAARRKLHSAAKLTPEELRQAGGDPHIVKLLFVGLCCHEKGLFDAVEAVALANRHLAQSNSKLRLHLTAAGEFMSASDRAEFEARVAKPDLQLPESHVSQGAHTSVPASSVTYIGFISGEKKNRIFAESDCFCFPTYYHAESFGMVLIEAMAFGLPVVATRWRSIPELFPYGYSGLVDVRAPEQLAACIRSVVIEHNGKDLRDTFLRRFTVQTYLNNAADALRSLEGPEDRT